MTVANEKAASLPGRGPSVATLFDSAARGPMPAGRATTTPEPFTDHRLAALALLNGNHRLTRKAGSFLGQLAVDAMPMSEAQADWLAKLLDKHRLPALARGSGQ